MVHDPLSATGKPCLDDLLTTIGITREQLMEMTADDLFAAATQWQNLARVTAAEPALFGFPDGPPDSRRASPADLSLLN